ncbi:Ribosomal protein S21 family protein [Candida parapsilosis]|uniref:Ribosomal protein S21 family protein n=1 Tax=Candida parapsilosis TaxID=5480 RepID=A0A8X7TB19_CANPA|nr:Ribosomal protein S21 family protein [Candida parapsilosis]KAF6053163.1 Ribosomal protein S21 family protein [Candida parapsilosis]
MLRLLQKSTTPTTILRPSGFVITPLFIGSLRFNSTSKDVSAAKYSPKPESTVNIDDLLKNSIPDLSFSESINERFGFEANRQPTPREVAKGIREFGTNAGRTVDVNYNNLARAFTQIKRIGNENKIRYLQRVQSRYIRPAKYRKQLKREWWRRKFSAGFKNLLAQVNNARRRGY